MTHKPIILGIDPGTLNFGWGVLEGERVVEYGVLRASRQSTPLLRHLGIARLLESLMQQFEPSMIAYEEYTYRAREKINITGTFWMNRTIGLILGLGARYPLSYWPQHPQEWGKMLIGSTAHQKEDVATALNRRLHTSLAATQGGHHTDALGIALVTHDQWRAQRLILAQAHIAREQHGNGRRTAR